MRYKVDFGYSVPEWASVEVDADDEETARFAAKTEFERMFPEAFDSDIVGVTEID